MLNDFFDFLAFASFIRDLAIYGGAVIAVSLLVAYVLLRRTSRL